MMIRIIGQQPKSLSNGAQAVISCESLRLLPIRCSFADTVGEFGKHLSEAGQFSNEAI
jgi:hypothetical protein